MATQSTTPLPPTGGSSSTATNSSAAVSNVGGIWTSARQFFSFAQPKIVKDGDFSFQFLTSPQRSKPAAAVNADNFYMYACGSINMP